MSYPILTAKDIYNYSHSTEDITEHLSSSSNNQKEKEQKQVRKNNSMDTDIEIAKKEWNKQTTGIFRKDNLIHCLKCSQAFTSFEEIMLHLRTHQPFPKDCPICNKIFLERSSYDNHLLKHKQNKLKVIRCSFNCGGVFKTMKLYKSHKKKHMREIRKDEKTGDRTYLENVVWKESSSAMLNIINKVFHPFPSSETEEETNDRKEERVNNDNTQSKIIKKNEFKMEEDEIININE